MAYKRVGPPGGVKVIAMATKFTVVRWLMVAAMVALAIFGNTSKKLTEFEANVAGVTEEGGMGIWHNTEDKAVKCDKDQFTDDSCGEDLRRRCQASKVLGVASPAVGFVAAIALGAVYFKSDKDISMPMVAYLVGTGLVAAFGWAIFIMATLSANSHAHDTPCGYGGNNVKIGTGGWLWFSGALIATLLASFDAAFFMKMNGERGWELVRSSMLDAPLSA